MEPVVTTVPYESCEQFMDFLIDQGACHEARTWAAGKSLRQVVKTCTHYGWLKWLAIKKTYRVKDPAWGSQDNHDVVERFVYSAYDLCRIREGGGEERELEAEKAACDVWRKYYVISPRR